ncbi:MAG TPA: NAD-dependent epimerase/dehydratase family protein [Gemmatimonadales bacterium]|nr:NAD-dependent epimerase/dehydratase family protein [Gemmatimonadales bacterium]
MTSLANRRVALVGGAGFIGHNLALRLKELGADVTVIDSLAVNNFYSVRKDVGADGDSELYLRVIQQRLDLLRDHGIPLLVLDSRDYHRLSETIAELNPDALVHLAAVAHANRSNKDPHSTFDHSLRTLENALDVARSRNLNIRQFVYFSSSMVYGNFTAESVTEDTVCEPLGIYGALKFAGEKMVIAYNQVFGVPYTIIRPSALYGERCISRRVGQIFIESALKGQEVRINGDGSDRLDFTYIGDLVNGVVQVLTRDEALGEVFNLTYGESRSIGQMADILSEKFPEVAIQYLPKDRLMPKRGTLSVEKARRLIGYRPEWPLERGFPAYIDWYRSLVGAPAVAAA